MRAKGGLVLFIVLIINHLCFAQQGESSRVLVHTLNYLSHDYGGAVKDGKVISQSEFSEMKEFGETAVKAFKDCSGEWKKEDSAQIRTSVYRLDSLINKHAPFEIVAALCVETRNKVIAASGLKITPVAYPSINEGKIVFKTQCAKCHGDNGFGDGPEGITLNPRPRNFHDAEKMGPLSPFFIFNTVRLGVEGTGMKAHPELEDDEVWDVAFYVLTLRYQQFSNDAFLKSDEAKHILDSLNLDKISTTSDVDFSRLFGNSDTNKIKLILSAIRYNQPPQNNNDFIAASLKYLDGAMELYKNKKYSEAAQMATLSYLEGIEPLEMQLKSNDPTLMGRLEDQLRSLSKMMEEQRPATEIQDSLNAAKKNIETAGEVIGKKEYSFLLALFMAISILLREGLEAFLVIMVILSVLKAGKLSRMAAWVHAGWLLAVFTGVCIWFVSGSFIQNESEHLELLEGIISIVAVFMLLFVGFWLHSKSEIGKWKDYVNKMMKGVVANESAIGLAALSFFVVFREVFESVLFLSALNIESGGKQSHAIALGVLVAFAIVIAVAVLLLKFSTKLPILKLFKISSLVMGALAIVLAGKGVHSLQETGYISIHGISLFRVEMLGIFPTIETCLAQVAILIVLVLMWNINSLAPKK